MKDILYFFRLSRPLNVFITLLAFGLSCYIAQFNEFTFIQDPNFWNACIVLTIITGGGYWINDAFDYKIDQINKPDKTIVGKYLSRKKVITVYLAAMLIVTVFSWYTQGPVFWIINATAAVLLMFYSWIFKRVSVIGNLLVAALTALVVYYAAALYGIRWPLAWTMVFAFLVTFLRELTKDIEDIRGDLRFELNTLPIRIGIKGAKKVLFGAYCVFILACYLPLVEEWLLLRSFNTNYLLVSIAAVQIPAIYLMILLSRSKNPKDFSRQSLSLKLLIFAGMVSILFLK